MIRKKWQIGFWSYVVACYCSRIPALFIDWQKGVPPEDLPPALIDTVIVFLLLAPILTPIALYFETVLAFAWGFVMIERLLPLLTFIVVGVASWIIFNRMVSKTKEFDFLQKKKGTRSID